MVGLAGTDDFSRLVGLCYAERPTALGRYAPLVGAHAGDSTDAAAIVAEAAQAMTTTCAAWTRRPACRSCSPDRC